jgi:hypothetical protein
MKPLFILMILASSFFATTSSAADIISAKALKSFETTFTNAKEAAWTISESYYKVQFILNEQTLTAFYREDGKLLAVTRNISSLQLPIILQTELKKKYSNYWITELFEKSNDNGAEYYITIEDAVNKTVLKSFAGSGSWVVYQKSRKS